MAIELRMVGMRPARCMSLMNFFGATLRDCGDLREVVDQFGVGDGDFLDAGDFLEDEIRAEVGDGLVAGAGENLVLLGFDFLLGHAGLARRV